MFPIRHMAHGSLLWNKATIHKCCWYSLKTNLMHFSGWFDRDILAWSTDQGLHKYYWSVIPFNAHQLWPPFSISVANICCKYFRNLLAKNSHLSRQKSAVFSCMDWLIVLISPANYKGQVKVKTERSQWNQESDQLLQIAANRWNT